MGHDGTVIAKIYDKFEERKEYSGCIFNIDFKVNDKESFINTLDKLERTGVILKYEVVLENDD